MGRREYLDFELRVEREPRSRRKYSVKVIKSPAGEASGIFVLPFNERDLKLIKTTIENAVLRSRLPTTRRIPPPELRELQAFGHKLFEALFEDDLIRSCYERSLEKALQEEKGLRIRLRLDPTLARWPWEFLYSERQGDFLALSTNTPLVRYIEIPQRIAPLAVSPPLRILAMVSCPGDYPPLDVDREKEKICTALGELERQGVVEIEFLEEATLSALQDRLRERDFHIFHFIGHGGFDERTDEGALVLEDEAGRSKFVGGKHLGRLLKDHFPMRLVVLNACEGAVTSSADPFAGVATALVRAGLPAVVAMQFEISDRAAILFSREFYSALADNYPVDAAVAEARKAISYSIENTLEWATPVLFMRAPDGVIFQVPPVVAVKERREELARLYQAATEALAAKRWSKAIELLERILALDPRYRDASAMLAKARAEQERAKPWYKRRAFIGAAAALTVIVMALIGWHLAARQPQPRIQIESPRRGQRVTSRALEVTCLVSDESVSEIQLVLEDDVTRLYAPQPVPRGKYPVTVTSRITIPEASGYYTVTVHARDAGGRLVSSQQVPIVVEAPATLTLTRTVTPTLTRTSTPSPSPLMPTPTSIAPPPTPVTPISYRLTLLSPPDGASFGPETSVVTLQWQFGRALAPNEYFFVNVTYPHSGQTWYDGTWVDPARQIPSGTREASWQLRDYLCGEGLSDTGCFSWNVAVKRMKGNRPDLGDETVCLSPTWSFCWSGCERKPTPKPAPTPTPVPPTHTPVPPTPVPPTPTPTSPMPTPTPVLPTPTPTPSPYPPTD